MRWISFRLSGRLSESASETVATYPSHRVQLVHTKSLAQMRRGKGEYWLPAAFELAKADERYALQKK